MKKLNLLLIVLLFSMLLFISCDPNTIDPNIPVTLDAIPEWLQGKWWRMDDKVYLFTEDKILNSYNNDPDFEDSFNEFFTEIKEEFYDPDYPLVWEEKIEINSLTNLVTITLSETSSFANDELSCTVYVESIINIERVGVNSISFSSTDTIYTYDNIENKYESFEITTELDSPQYLIKVPDSFLIPDDCLYIESNDDSE